MQFSHNDTGFIFAINRTVILEHRTEAPCLYAGAGEPEIDMYRGNFQIRDYVSERIGLADFSVEMKGEEAHVTLSRKGIYETRLRFAEVDGRSVIEFMNRPSGVNRLWLRLHAEKEERVYGGGEQFSCFDLRGRNFPLWSSEQGVGRNKSTYITFRADVEDRAGGDYYWTFFPQPTFVSTRKYYCHVDNSAYMDFDFRNESFHELQVWDVPRRIIFETGDTYIDLVNKLSGLLGRQPELPEWVYNGVWLGIQGGTETCLAKLQKCLDGGVKVGAIWAQDWEGRRVTSFGKRLMWNWVWDKELYPGLDKEIPKLRERGIRFLGYINPYVAVEGSLFKEASKLGLLAKNDKGDDYLVDFGEFYAGVVDFTMPEACQWYRGVIKKYMIDLGLSGWMADFGEYLPTDVVLKNGDAMILHNAWPAIWARINREAVEEAGKLDDITFFMRAGYTGSQKYCTMMWAGDQNVDWSLDDGLASVVPAALSLGMCGMGLHHSDIGGYTTLFGMKRTRELFVRWAEMAAFTPLMRTHEGNRPDDNWQFDSDDETIASLARMTRVYTGLAPYIKSVVGENSRKGVPVQRPLFMHYEDDPQAYTIQYQYLFGRDILVAPVYDEGASEWEAYLPEDRWIHFWSGTEYSGGKVTVDVPWGEPAVFYRKDSDWKDLFEEIGKIE